MNCHNPFETVDYPINLLFKAYPSFIMKHLRMLRSLRFVATFSLLILLVNANAQVQTPRYVSTTSNSGGYYEYLPTGYNNSSQSYPLIVFVHGIGELGSGSAADLPKLLNCWNALPRLIANGQFPATFNVGGQQQGFIVVSPQFKAWPSAADLNSVINYAVQTYRVNQNRIYVTGLSMGGGATWDFAAAYPTRAAAVVPICGATWPDLSKARAIASAKLPVWATHNESDPTVTSSYTKDWVSNIVNNGGNAKKTIFPTSGHDAWTKTYDPTYRENNLNIYEWMLQFQKGGSTPTPSPAPSPAPSPSPIPVATINLPGKVEAENYSSMSGVQTENTSDAGGGKNVGWIDNGDWMQYSVNVVTAGTYTVNLRVATPNYNTQLQIKNSSGAVLATVNAPTTGGFQSWQTVSATVNLSAGSQTLKIQSTGAPWNFNWMEFVQGASTPPPTAPATGTTTRIEAEAWSAMSGVQTDNTTDAGGGKLVGWIDNGDWMQYNYTAPATGSYTLNFRLATIYNGAQFVVKNSSGQVLATVNVPTTGGFQSWRTVSATVNLSAGSQTLRLQSSAQAGWNINWLEVVSGSSSMTPPPTAPATGTTTRIEAEAWSAMSGVQTDNTTDAGGGKLVGWIDNGDWMQYNYTAPATGSYTLNFRLATIYNGAQFVVKNSSGQVLATVNVPTTGGFQSWRTVSATVNLSAGSQTLRLQSSAQAGWNINWLEVVSGSSLYAAAQRSSAIMSTETTNASTAPALDVYPNPVSDRFVLQINNSLTGAVNVQVVNLQGAVQKQFSLTKADATTSQFYLSIGELAAAGYIVKVTMNDWTDSKQIIKQ